TGCLARNNNMHKTTKPWGMIDRPATSSQDSDTTSDEHTRIPSTFKTVDMTNNQDDTL
ncbi:hypothetical protein AC1031_013228, partial [Aphanomyces cochlioides]